MDVLSVCSLHYFLYPTISTFSVYFYIIKYNKNLFIFSFSMKLNRIWKSTFQAGKVSGIYLFLNILDFFQRQSLKLSFTQQPVWIVFQDHCPASSLFLKKTIWRFNRINQAKHISSAASTLFKGRTTITEQRRRKIKWWSRKSFLLELLNMAR